MAHHGSGLLRAYGNSYPRLLMALYPLAPWLPWRFTTTPTGYWESKENQRAYMLWLGAQLGYGKREDWYALSIKDLETHRGLGLLHLHYGGSPSALLAATLPELHLDSEPWRFAKLPDHVRSSAVAMARLLAHVEHRLGLRSRRDWQRVSLSALRELGLHSPFVALGGVESTLERYYSTLLDMRAQGTVDAALSLSLPFPLSLDLKQQGQALADVAAAEIAAANL